MLKQLFKNPFILPALLIFFGYVFLFHDFSEEETIRENIYVENEIHTVEVPNLGRTLSSTGNTIRDKLEVVRQAVEDSQAGKSVLEGALAPALKKEFGTADQQVVASTVYGIPQREIRKEGSGAALQCGDTATIALSGNYYGTGNQKGPLPDRFTGKKTVRLGANQLVPGLEQQLVGLRPGAVASISVPPALGHGQEGFTDAGIPENSIARYDVTVLDVAPVTFSLRRAASYTEQKEGSGRAIGCGDRVTVQYILFAIGTAEQKKLSSPGKETKSFALGDGTMPVGLEAGVDGMRLGGVRHILIAPDQLYSTGATSQISELQQLKKGQGVLAIVLVKELNGVAVQVSPPPSSGNEHQ